MAENLKGFISEEKEISRRYRYNLEAIIQKYDRPFKDDVEIDLETMTMTHHTERDDRIMRKMKPKIFGKTKLYATKSKNHEDHSMSVLSVCSSSNVGPDESVYSILSRSHPSEHEMTLQHSPSDRLSVGGNRTFTNDVSLHSYNSHEDDDEAELLSLQTTYLEIINDRLDEPNDVETLSSCSSESLGNSGDSDSIQADDEESQTDDTGQQIRNQRPYEDSSSLSSIDETYRNRQRLAHRRRTETRNDEVDGHYFCHTKDRENVYERGTFMSPKGKSKDQYIRTDSMDSLDRYDKNRSIEQWVEDTNIKTGIDPSPRKNVRGPGRISLQDQTYIVPSEGRLRFDQDRSDKMDDIKIKNYEQQLERHSFLDDGGKMEKTHYGAPSSKTWREPQKQSAKRRIIPVSLGGSKNQVPKSENLFQTKTEKTQCTAVQEDKYEIRDTARTHSAIAKFASPDRLLKKMRENKVGVAARMFIEPKVKSPDEFRQSLHHSGSKSKLMVKTDTNFPIKDDTISNENRAFESDKFVFFNQNRNLDVKDMKQVQGQETNRQMHYRVSKTDIISDNKATDISQGHQTHSIPHSATPPLQFKSSNTTSGRLTSQPLQPPDLISVSVTQTRRRMSKPCSPESVLMKTETSNHKCKTTLLQIPESQPQYESTNLSRESQNSRPEFRTTIIDKENIANSCQHYQRTNRPEKFEEKGERISQNQISDRLYVERKRQAVANDIATETWVTPPKFKRKFKRRFVPHEESAKLVDLILHPEPEVSNVLTPKTFHEKYNKHTSLDVKPVFEAKQCLAMAGSDKLAELKMKLNSSMEVKKQPFEYENRYFDKQSESIKNHGIQRFNLYQMDYGTQMSRSQQTRQKFVPWKQEVEFPYSREDNSSGKQKMHVAFSERQFGYEQGPEKNTNVTSPYQERPQMFREQDPLSQSPYKSARDLTSIDQFTNSLFWSPNLPRKESNYISMETSKSVPPKLFHHTNIRSGSFDPNTMPSDQISFNRTKLKAKRSLQLLESMKRTQLDNGSCHDENTQQYLTPSKRDLQQRNEDSPSTVLSRLLLNTPSSRDRQHFLRQHSPHIAHSNVEQRGTSPWARPSVGTFSQADRYAESGYFSQPTRTCTERYENYSGRACDAQELSTKNSIQHTINQSNEQSRALGHCLARPLVKISSEGRRKALFQSTPRKKELFTLENTFSTIHGDMSDDSDCEVYTISN